MDPILLVILVVLGYLLAGAVTARGLWHLRHKTVAGPSDTAAVLLAWPLVLAIAGGTWAVDGVHQLVTRPTSKERLEQQRTRGRGRGGQIGHADLLVVFVGRTAPGPGRRLSTR